MEALIHNNKHSVVYGRKTIDFSLRRAWIAAGRDGF